MSFGLGGMRKCDHTELGVYYLDGAGCPKCEGFGEYYDLDWQPHTGDLALVTDLDLLWNLTRKAILTSRETSYFHPEYGTQLQQHIGTISNDVYAKAAVEMEVTRTLAGLMMRQKQQLAAGQVLTSNEELSRVDSIETSLSDMRTLNVEVHSTTRGGQEVNVIV